MGKKKSKAQDSSKVWSLMALASGIGGATIAKKAEKHFKCPQDIEWALDRDLQDGENLLLLQCRPETVWSGVERAPAFDPKDQMMSWITSSITVPTKVHSGGGHRHG